MEGTSPVSSRWMASRIASASALNDASALNPNASTQSAPARRMVANARVTAWGDGVDCCLLVVVVLAADDVDVEGHARALRERLEHVRDHLARQIPDLLALELQVAAEVRPRGDVEHGAGERLPGRGTGWQNRPSQRVSHPALFARNPRRSRTCLLRPRGRSRCPTA